jgi:hypothetical protein
LWDGKLGKRERSICAMVEGRVRNENEQKRSAGEKEKQSPRRPGRVQTSSPHTREPISNEKEWGNNGTLRSTCTRHSRRNRKWRVVRTQPSTRAPRLSGASSKICMPTTHRHFTAPRCRGTERGTGGAIERKQRWCTTTRSAEPTANGKRKQHRTTAHAHQRLWPRSARVPGRAHSPGRRRRARSPTDRTARFRTTSTARARAQAARPVAVRDRAPPLTRRLGRPSRGGA